MQIKKTYFVKLLALLFFSKGNKSNLIKQQVTVFLLEKKIIGIYLKKNRDFD